MSEIKSEKAKNHIEKWQWQSKGGTFDNSPIILRSIAEDAVIIAETEAEERHAKALQELKDKAVEAFAAVCKSNFGTDCERCAHGVDGDYCRVLELFTQKLNEK